MMIVLDRLYIVLVAVVSILQMYATQPQPTVKMLKACIAYNGTPMTELRDVACHMGSHSVTFHPTQVNAPRPNPNPQAGTRFTYPGRIEG